MAETGQQWPRISCVIAIDSNDLPHIAYVDRDNGGVIKYARGNQSWDFSEIDEEGEFISIDVDTQDRAHFSYYDVSDRTFHIQVPTSIRSRKASPSTNNGEAFVWPWIAKMCPTWPIKI